MRRGEIAHNISRGAFFLGLERGAALLSGIAYFALLLRWLGPTKYGIMTLALSFAGLATTATGNFEVFLERYAAEYQARGEFATLRRAHRLALALKLALGLVASVVLVALAPMLGRKFGIPELVTLLPLLTLIVATDGLATTGRATLYGMQRFEWVSGLALVFHVAKTVMVGLMWFARLGLVELAWGLSLLTALQAVVMSAVPAWLLRRRSGGALAPGAAGSHTAEREAQPHEQEAQSLKELFHSMVSYCGPLLGARLAFTSGQNLSKVVLGKLFDATQLGYFSFAFQTLERFVELVKTLPDALLPSLTHLVAREERERLRDVFDQALRLIQVAACGLSLAVFVFAPELTVLVASPLFRPAIPLLRIMALVPIARTAQQPLTMLFQAMRRPTTVLVLALIKFATEFGCYFLLVPTLGLSGAGWANLAGAVASYLAALAILNRLLPEGAGERARTAATSVALAVPLLVAALFIDHLCRGPVAPALRAGLLLVAIIGVFALGLVTRYDLEKLSSVPLGAAWLRRARNAAVSGAGALLNAFEPRRAS